MFFMGGANPAARGAKKPDDNPAIVTQDRMPTSLPRGASSVSRRAYEVMVMDNRLLKEAAIWKKSRPSGRKTHAAEARCGAGGP